MTPRRGRRTGPSTFDRRLLLPMIGGAVLNPVNSSLIAVALVPIGLALGAPATETAWLVSGLYLATAVGQPVTGRLVDLYGPRPLYLAGAVLVGVGGVLGRSPRASGGWSRRGSSSGSGRVRATRRRWR